jgi:hypothetical protein
MFIDLPEVSSHGGLLYFSRTRNRWDCTPLLFHSQLTVMKGFVAINTEAPKNEIKRPEGSFWEETIF